MTIVERHKAVVQIGFWSSLLSALLAVGWIVTLAVQMSIAPAAQWSGLEQYVRDFRPIEMLNLVPSLLVIAYPQLADLRIFLLATRDAHELYRRRSGFEVLESAERWMIRRRD